MTLSAEHILNACRAAFPERAALRVESVNPLNNSHHPMVSFFLRWDGGGSQPLIFRRYASPLSWHSLGEIGRADREFAVLHWLKDHKLGTPGALAHGADEAGGWLLMETLPGRNWWLPFGLVNFDRVLPGIVHQQVRRLARLHSLDAAALQGVVPVITVEGVLARLREKLRATKEPDIRGAVDKAAALLAGADEADASRHMRLLNVDAQISHALVDSAGSVAAWLDWDDAALGDPRWDVAALLNSLRGSYHMHALAARAAADYARESLRSLRHIAAWTALYALVRWASAVWLLDERRAGHHIDFPAAGRIMANCDSYRAWAVEILREAQPE